MSLEVLGQQRCFPTFVWLQESSFWGRASKWTGPLFATLHFGSIHLYKVMENMEFQINLKSGAFHLYIEPGAERYHSEDLTLRLVQKEDALHSNSFFITCASPEDREYWISCFRQVLAPQQITRIDQTGLENPERNNPHFKSLTRPNRVLCEDILLCSNIVSVVDGHLSSADTADRRSWSRRFMRLTNLGHLQCFSVSAVACVDIRSRGAQILVEEAAASLVGQSARKAKLTTKRTMQIATSVTRIRKNENAASTTEANTEANDTWEGLDAIDVASLSDSSDSDDDSEMVGTVSNTASLTPSSAGTQGRTVPQSTIDSWRVRSVPSRSFADLQFFAFTIVGTKVHNLPTFPFERSTAGLSNFWRKASNSSSLTLGAYSESERSRMTADIQQYLKQCRYKELQKRKKETESARVLCKGWMMMRGLGTFKTWKKRFCVFLSTHEFVYYKNELDGSKYKRIDLAKLKQENFTIRQMPPKSPSRDVLEIKFRKKRGIWIYPCQMESRILQNWLEHLQSICQPLIRTPTSPSSDDNTTDGSLFSNGSPSHFQIDEELNSANTSFANINYTKEQPKQDQQQLLNHEQTFQRLKSLPSFPGEVRLGSREKGERNLTELGVSFRKFSYSDPVTNNESSDEVAQSSFKLQAPKVAIPPSQNGSFSSYGFRGTTFAIHSNKFLVRPKSGSVGSGASGTPTSRSSSFDVGSTITPNMQRYRMNRSLSGGTMDWMRDGRQNDIFEYARVVERNNWQRMTGNTPIECLSLSPYSGQILAETLLGKTVQTNNNNTL